MTDGFPSQRDNNAKSGFMSWRHHESELGMWCYLSAILILLNESPLGLILDYQIIPQPDRVVFATGDRSSDIWIISDFYFMSRTSTSRVTPYNIIVLNFPDTSTKPSSVCPSTTPNTSPCTTPVGVLTTHVAWRACTKLAPLTVSLPALQIAVLVSVFPARWAKRARVTWRIVGPRPTAIRMSSQRWSYAPQCWTSRTTRNHKGTRYTVKPLYNTFFI